MSPELLPAWPRTETEHVTQHDDMPDPMRLGAPDQLGGPRPVAVVVPQQGVGMDIDG